MNKLSFLIISALVFSFSSINALTIDSDLRGGDLLSTATKTDKVVYDIINKNPQDKNEDGYIDNISFTVTWLYNGPLEHPHIAYIVSIRTIFGTEIVNFQDSKIGGTAYGSKNYSINLDTPLAPYEAAAFNYSIVGSDGSYVR